MRASQLLLCSASVKLIGRGQKLDPHRHRNLGGTFLDDETLPDLDFVVTFE